jgi:ABC-type lipoprotein release transport system permease subunit
MVRSMKQIGVGVVVGGLIVAAIPRIPINTIVVERDLRLLFGLSVLMVVVGILAAAGPARRGLRIPPTEALRGD